MEELIKERINQESNENAVKEVDLEQVILENRRKVQEDLRKAAEEAKAARIAKFKAEDEELFRAFNAGVQRRMIEAMNLAASEQMAKADEQIMNMFKPDKPTVKMPQEPSKSAVQSHRRRKQKYPELGNVATWFIAWTVFIGLIARLLGMA